MPKIEFNEINEIVFNEINDDHLVKSLRDGQRWLK